jgi:hypothetical protein
MGYVRRVPPFAVLFGTQDTTFALVSPPQIEQRTYTMDGTELATEKTACRASNETQTTSAHPKSLGAGDAPSNAPAQGAHGALAPTQAHLPTPSLGTAQGVN